MGEESLAAPPGGARTCCQAGPQGGPPPLPSSRGCGPRERVARDTNKVVRPQAQSQPSQETPKPTITAPPAQKGLLKGRHPWILSLRGRRRAREGRCPRVGARSRKGRRGLEEEAEGPQGKGR